MEQFTPPPLHKTEARVAASSAASIVNTRGGRRHEKADIDFLSVHNRNVNCECSVQRGSIASLGGAHRGMEHSQLTF